MAAIAASATPKAIIRASEKFMSPMLTPGSRTPMLRNSTPKATVAIACRKNSTPPVTSSWLIGSADSTGRMMNWCRQAPRTPTSRIPKTNASARCTPITECIHQIAYMPTMISSA